MYFFYKFIIVYGISGIIFRRFDFTAGDILKKLHLYYQNKVETRFSSVFFHVSESF